MFSRVVKGLFNGLFGTKEIAIPDWSPVAPSWSNETFDILIQDDVNKLPKQTVENIIQNSDKFSIKFPVDTSKCKTLQSYVSHDILEKNINSVYPIVHENILELCCKFILFKRKYGSEIEKLFYQDMSLKEFINRLLTKRAVMFVNSFDRHILLNGTNGSLNWETIGTDQEKLPLVLQDCLSYDEIKLSVFFSVSSYTYFVNIGNRTNVAKYEEDRSKVEDEGIIIGLIGPRLAKLNVMEYQEILLSEKQNTKGNGYGNAISNSLHKLFADFYEENCLTYKEALQHKNSLSLNDGRYAVLETKELFDNHYYYKRLTFSIDTLLMEANYRAKLKGTTAYIHVVGLGLGVWKVSFHQDKVYMETFAKRIESLAKYLGNISDICFAYIDHNKCGECRNGQTFRIKEHHLGGIKIHIYKREPHTKLDGHDKGKLLVVSYPWDGNALPGNEYWSGRLRDSGDSAAASSTQITELHNSHINPLVSADNLMVVAYNKVLPFMEYQDTTKNGRREN